MLTLVFMYQSVLSFLLISTGRIIITPESKRKSGVWDHVVVPLGMSWWIQQDYAGKVDWGVINEERLWLYLFDRLDRVKGEGSEHLWRYIEGRDNPIYSFDEYSAQLKLR